MTRWKVASLLGLVMFCSMGNACVNESDRQERQAVERGQLQLLRNQPPPVYDWSLERHLLSQLYDARNNAVATYAVVQNPYTGRIMWSCPSIGFPLPADTQLTNPLKPAYAEHSSGIVEQAEPNGLYTSKNTRGTWVFCVDQDGKVTPVNEEKDVTTFLMPMKEVEGRLVPVEGAKPSLRLDPKKPVQQPPVEQ